MDMLSNLNIPLYILPGEKDFMDLYIDWTYEVTWSDRTERLAELKALWDTMYPGDDPWYTFTHNGVTFFAADSLAGSRWQEGNGITGSFGEDQLTALERAIDASSQLIFMSHHPGPMTLEEQGDVTLQEVLTSKADNVIALFNGHLLTYSEYDLAGISGFGFGGVNKDSGYYAVVNVVPETGEVTVVNKVDLPYPPVWQDFSCTPGEDTVGSLSGLTDSYHSYFISGLTSDNWLINLLISSINTGNSPLPMWVLDADTQPYQIMMTHGYLVETHWEGGDWAVTPQNNFGGDPPCEIYNWTYSDPCISTVDASLTYNLLQFLEPNGYHASCRVELAYTADVLFESKMGDDIDGNLTFADGHFAISLLKADVMDTIDQFFVDSYCENDDCQGGDMLMPQVGCSPAGNGDKAACLAGTLEFDDVPGICDTEIGSIPAVSVRLIRSIVDMLPDNFDIEFQVSAWGHEMTFSDDFSSDWNIGTDVFENAYCPSVD